MKMAMTFSLLAVTLACPIRADFSLAHNQKKVVCYGEDNQDWELNKKRTTVKYTIEGESLGAKKITKRESDGNTYVSYSTSEGTLSLSDQGDTYTFRGEPEAQEIRCK